MNEQNIPQPNEPIQSSKHIWITIIAIVITAIIVGGGVYIWQKSNLESMEQSFNQQVLDLQSQIENVQKQAQTTDDQKTLQQSGEKKNQGSLSQPDEITKIIQEISVYCEKYNIPECLPVTSYTVVDLDDKHGVVKINGFSYLLTKKDNEWNVNIVSQENNICETGSNSPDLVEYCSR